MGQIKAALSERRVAQLARKRGARSMHAVGGAAGLYLHVGKTGSASWVLRYTFKGKPAFKGKLHDYDRWELGLGSYLKLSLAEARALALKKHALIAQGINPLLEKRKQRDESIADAAKFKTFQQCVDGYLDAHGDGWRNPRHRGQWRTSLEKYACPTIGAMNVAAIDTALVLKILEPIWKSKTETATRVRSRIENVLTWATVRKYRQGENPARWKGHLDQLLAKPSKIATVKHFAALPYRDMGAFMKALRAQEGIGAAALEFAILTAARSGEVRGAIWDEIDLSARTWSIPAERMKAKRDHVVPLSDAAVAVIEKMSAHPVGDLVFPGAKEARPLSDMSMTAVLRRMGHGDLTAHGFRSSFRDWAAESTAYPAEMAEMALAHSIGNKVEAAYRRGNLFDKRVRMMRDWAKHCATVPKASADVVPMRRASAKQ